MNKFLILMLILLAVVLSGCSSPKGNSDCDAACLEKGFIGGTCQALGVTSEPCEAKFNTTTIYSQDGYCDEYGRDKFSWWEWNIQKTRIEGIGNACCCN